jgi:hypothetical protein
MLRDGLTHPLTQVVLTDQLVLDDPARRQYSNFQEATAGTKDYL